MSEKIVNVLDFTSLPMPMTGAPAGWVYADMKRSLSAEEWVKFMWILGDLAVDYIWLARTERKDGSQRAQFLLSPKAAETYKQYTNDAAKRKESDALYAKIRKAIQPTEPPKYKH